MNKPKIQNANSGAISWMIASIFKCFYESAQKAYSWFSLEKESLPEDEAGELMRRTLAQKSWFDALSSAWVDQPFWIKCVVVGGMTLAAGVIGLLLNIPVLLMCIVCAVSVSTHSLFVAHERQRINSAKIITQEAIALTQDLKASQQLLDQTVTTIEQAADKLTKHSETMSSNTNRLEEGVDLLKKHQEQFTVRVDEVTEATAELIAAETQVKKQLEKTATTFHNLTDVIVETTKHTSGIGKATTQFEEVVHNFQVSQQTYTKMVAQIAFFVNENQLEKPNMDSLQKSDFTNALNAELNANDELINEMRKGLGGVA